MTKAEIVKTCRRISRDWEWTKRNLQYGDDYIRADTMSNAWEMAAELIELELEASR
jgi:hypothetical protein